MRNQQFTRSPDDPFQFDDPPVPAPVILSQSNPVIDHRDDLPHHIRTQLQSRIHKPAQNLEPDAKRLRLDAGKRGVLMLSHDVSSGPECCKPATIFKSCENSGCADVLLTRRTANKEVQHDALREVAAGTCGRCNGSRMGQVERIRSHEVPVQEAAERHHEAKPRPEKSWEPRWVFTEKTIQGKPDYKARHQDRCTHWIARRLFHDALGSSSKRLGPQACSMLSQRISDQTASRELLLVADPCSWDESQGKCLLLLYRSTGREMLDVRGTSTTKKSARGSWFCGVKAGTRSFLPAWTIWTLRLSCTHMSTTFCLRSRKPPRKYKDALQHLVRKLHLKQQSGLVVYCGRTICRDGNHTKVTQTRSTMSLECMNIGFGWTKLWKARSRNA